MMADRRWVRAWLANLDELAGIDAAGLTGGETTAEDENTERCLAEVQDILARWRND